MGGMNAKNGPNFRIVGGRMRCGFLRFGGLGAQGLGFRYRFFLRETQSQSASRFLGSSDGLPTCRQ